VLPAVPLGLADDGRVGEQLDQQAEIRLRDGAQSDLIVHEAQPYYPPARRAEGASWRIRAAARSAVIMTVTTGLTEGIVGNTDASATRSPSTPRTRSSGSSTASGSSGAPIRQVPLTWETVWWGARASAEMSASDTACGRG